MALSFHRSTGWRLQHRCRGRRRRRAVHRRRVDHRSRQRRRPRLRDRPADRRRGRGWRWFDRLRPGPVGARPGVARGIARRPAAARWTSNGRYGFVDLVISDSWYMNPARPRTTCAWPHLAALRHQETSTLEEKHRRRRQQRQETGSSLFHDRFQLRSGGRPARASHANSGRRAMSSARIRSDRAGPWATSTVTGRTTSSKATSGGTGTSTARHDVGRSAHPGGHGLRQEPLTNLGDLTATGHGPRR